jgi:hypothetical protein
VKSILTVPFDSANDPGMWNRPIYKSCIKYFGAIVVQGCDTMIL